VGLKPSGGIQTVSQALRWTALARDELGERWLTPDLLRIGASKLADDIEKRLLT
jgi:deoxyribose-phosphate aldolase